jgi:sugar phosphate isomerase/epimerase
VSNRPAFGVVLRDLPNGSSESVVAALDAAARTGADRLQIPSVRWLDPELGPIGLRSARAAAAARGMQLDAQLGILNAVWPERGSELLGLGDGDVLRGVERAATAAQTAGIETLHFTIGQLEDRDIGTPPWQEQLERSAELVDAAARIAEAASVRLILKTHEEMSSADVAAVIHAAGGRIGVGLSPVNLLVGLEEPVAATRRLADQIHTVFLDDASLVRTRTGYQRRMEPMGRGTIDWPAVLAELAGRGAALTLDVHRAAFDIPCFEPGWPRTRPDVTVDEFAALAATARGPVTETQAGPEDRFEVGAAWLRKWIDPVERAA